MAELAEFHSPPQSQSRFWVKDLRFSPLFSPWYKQSASACSHLSRPAYPTQKGIIFLRNNTSRHIGYNFLLKSGRRFLWIWFDFLIRGCYLRFCRCRLTSLWGEALLFTCSLFVTLRGMLMHLVKPREEAFAGSSPTTISVCQDVLNVKTGKYYPVVLLLEGPLPDCFKMWILFHRKYCVWL